MSLRSTYYHEVVFTSLNLRSPPNHVRLTLGPNIHLESEKLHELRGPRPPQSPCRDLWAGSASPREPCAQVPTTHPGLSGQLPGVPNTQGLRFPTESCHRSQF